MSLLTNEEAQYVHNVEVLGLPTTKAAQLAGLPYSKTRETHILEARAKVRREMLGDLRVTKEDSARGILDAIDQAKILADPTAQIAGWKEINQMYGHNAPQKIDINMQESILVVKQQVRSLPDAELVKLLGAGDVIDAEFYEKK